jgi:transposase
MNRVEVITSVERRRRWSMAEKAQLVAAMDEPDAVVTEIARAAGVDVSLLYRWRRQLAATREAPAFAPLMVAFDASEPESAIAPVSPSTPSPAPTSITVAFGAQVRMTIEGAPDAATLSSVIGALTARDRLR